ncbi:tetratricopeptide repeat protein, partial [Porphyromonas loveana]
MDEKNANQEEVIKLSNVPEPNRQEAIVCYNRGVDSILAGLYDAAIKDFSEAIKLDDKFVHAYAYQGRGRAYYEKGLYDAAIKDFSE